MEGVSYITNEKGRKTAIVIDLKKHADHLEDFLDGLEAEKRKYEAKESYLAIRKELIAQGKLKK